ncbi:MAG: hypothetical protein AAGE98_09520 [Actinomycetota bacterium]
MTTEVLVIGPDEAAIGFIAGVLERAGLRARAVPSIRAAAEVNAVHPALVLIDTDLEAVRSIRSLADPKLASVDIVVLGPDPAGTDDAQASTDAGATHHVPRPIAEAALIQGVRSILDNG